MVIWKWNYVNIECKQLCFFTGKPAESLMLFDQMIKKTKKQNKLTSILIQSVDADPTGEADDDDGQHTHHGRPQLPEAGGRRRGVLWGVGTPRDEEHLRQVRAALPRQADHHHGEGVRK